MRALSGTWVRPEAKRSPDAQTSIDPLTAVDPSIAQAYQLGQAFPALARERRGGELDAWMTAAPHRGSETLARFAQGLQEDLAVVKAGLTLPWSNSPVESQITPLQWLKRQGYGRGGFPLIRRRALQAA